MKRPAMGRAEIPGTAGDGIRLGLALLLAGAPAAQEGEPPPKPAPAERPCSPAERRACTVLKLAGYLTPEKPPPQPDGATRRVYRIGVVGNDAVTAAAERLLPGKRVDGADVLLVQVASLRAIEGRAAEVCDLLYVAGSIEDRVLARIVAVHANVPMPIVCERPGFAARGGGVQLFADADDDGEIRFEINVETLQAQGVKASPQLLRLSRKGPAP